MMIGRESGSCVVPENAARTSYAGYLSAGVRSSPLCLCRRDNPSYPATPQGREFKLRISGVRPRDHSLAGVCRVRRPGPPRVTRSSPRTAAATVSGCADLAELLREQQDTVKLRQQQCSDVRPPADRPRQHRLTSAAPQISSFVTELEELVERALQVCSSSGRSLRR